MLPDVAEPEQARRLAAPSTSPSTRDAVLLTVRDAIQPNLRADFRDFIHFRLDERNNRARRDYIDQLTEVWQLCSNGDTENARTELGRKVASDLEKARSSYFDRVGLRPLIAGGLAISAALIPLTAGVSAAAIATAVTGASASGMVLVVRNGAPRFVRSMAGSGLLASTAPRHQRWRWPPRWRRSH